MKSVETMIAEALAAGQTTLSEYDSKKILAEYGIPTTEDLLIDELAAAEQAAEQIGYPVVLKVCAAAAQHKTEQNLIELGIGNAVELKKAYDRLAPKARNLGGAILVQEMIRGSRELVAGLNRDKQFGPCVMFGLGGIFTEALGDVVFRVAPLSRKDAREMTTDIKGAKILQDLRGLEPVHIDELSNCLQQLGQIAIDHPAVCEIDINPLIVRKGHPVAVDALIVLQEPQAPATTEKAVTGNLTKFFEPQSVAVIGASGTPHKAGNDVIQNILANEFEGRLYLVNPKGGEILGHRVYPSIQDLPENIDQAIIILPARATPQAIRDCAARGAKTVVLAAGGFAEVDQQGEELQQETIQAIQDTGVRAIGPNTSGHTSTPHKFTSTFFPLGKVPRGNVSYIAQTGNFATHTMRYIMTAEHFGVARVLGMGNKLDVEESEVLEYYAQDPETEAIVTIGVKEGISHLILVTIRPGDVVFAPNPTYPIHPYSTIIAGGDVRGIPLGSDQDFFHNLLHATRQTWPRPKVLIISYPHNPTTEIVDLAFYEKIVAFAKEHDIMVIHDFAYADLTYDGYKAPSFLQVEGAKDVGVEFFSLSKSYSMPGWRVGFCVGNRETVAALRRIKSYLDYGMFQPVQIASTVTINEASDWMPMFSPDGGKIVFGANRNPDKPRATDVFIADWVE